jgi:hypothetical protein
MTTTTTEIPRDQWSFLCDSFSRQYDAWPAFLEVIGPDVGDQVQADALPFRGIVVEEAGGDTVVSLMFGDSDASHLTHRIRNPVRLSLEHCDAPARAFEILAIEDGTEVMTLLRFKAQILPEMLDGIGVWSGRRDRLRLNARRIGLQNLKCD